MRWAWRAADVVVPFPLGRKCFRRKSRKMLLAVELSLLVLDDDDAVERSSSLSWSVLSLAVPMPLSVRRAAACPTASFRDCQPPSTEWEESESLSSNVMTSVVAGTDVDVCFTAGAATLRAVPSSLGRVKIGS